MIVVVRAQGKKAQGRVLFGHTRVIGRLATHRRRKGDCKNQGKVRMGKARGVLQACGGRQVCWVAGRNGH